MRRFLKDFAEGCNPLYWFAWALYWLGDLASRPLYWRDTDRWVGFWYLIYNRLMLASSAVQDCFGFSGPWRPAQEEA